MWTLPALASLFTFLYNDKYSFHKKLGLRFATIYVWCLSNKPSHISKAATKIFIGEFQARMWVVGFTPFLAWNTVKRSFIHSFVPFNRIYYLVIPYAILQHFIWFHITAKDALMTCIPPATAKPMAVTTFVLTAYDCSRHLYEQHSRHKGQAALWVTNSCISMSKPITT